MNNLRLFLSLSLAFIIFSENSHGNYKTYTYTSSPIEVGKQRKERGHRYSNDYRGQRKKLEARNDRTIKNEIENIRLGEERKLSGKIKKAFRNIKGDQNGFRVRTTNVSTAIHQNYSLDEEKEGPYFATPNPFLSRMKFSPYFGVSHLKGSLGEYQSDMVIGGNLETAVNPFLSVSIGLNYFNVNLPDSLETHSWNDLRGTKLSKLGLEIGPKIFIISKNNLRPYLGVNIGLNQMSLKKDMSLNEAGYYSSPMKVSFDSLFWGLRVGTEYYFNESMGLNAFVNYSWQQGDSAASPNVEFQNHVDLIKKAKMRSINFGMVILL